MNYKLYLAAAGLLATCFSHAQTTTEQYSFNIGSGYTLTNVAILEINPADAWANWVALPGTFTGKASGSFDAGYFNGNTLYLNLIAQYTDPNGNVGLAFSMPSGLATTLTANPIPFDDPNPGSNPKTDPTKFFDSSYYFQYGALPSEAQSLAYLQMGGSYMNSLAAGLSYLPATDPVLSTSGGTIMGFSNSHPVGTFEYSPVPEPSILLAAPLGLLALRRRRA